MVDLTLGRERGTGNREITENFHDHGNESHLFSPNYGSSAKLLMPSDALFMRDLRMYLRTDKYVKQNQSSNRVEVKLLQEKANSM
jgi:hypothetical protein